MFLICTSVIHQLTFFVAILYTTAHKGTDRAFPSRWTTDINLVSTELAAAISLVLFWRSPRLFLLFSIIFYYLTDLRENESLGKSLDLLVSRNLCASCKVTSYLLICFSVLVGQVSKIVRSNLKAAPHLRVTELFADTTFQRVQS